VTDQVTSSGGVGILTFTSNLIKSRINKGFSLMEIHGELMIYDQHDHSTGKVNGETAGDERRGEGSREQLYVHRPCFIRDHKYQQVNRITNCLAAEHG
jgi:hypothetical protein